MVENGATYVEGDNKSSAKKVNNKRYRNNTDRYADTGKNLM
jgi:hypothetical protein